MNGLAVQNRYNRLQETFSRCNELHFLLKPFVWWVEYTARQGHVIGNTGVLLHAHKEEIILNEPLAALSSVEVTKALESPLLETQALILPECDDWLMLMRFVELKSAA